VGFWGGGGVSFWGGGGVCFFFFFFFFWGGGGGGGGGGGCSLRADLHLVSEVKKSLSVITELVEGDVYHWGPLMAGALLGSLPVVLL